MNMNDCIQQLEATGDYKIIKRLAPKSTYWDDTGSQKRLCRKDFFNHKM